MTDDARRLFARARFTFFAPSLPRSSTFITGITIFSVAFFCLLSVSAASGAERRPSARRIRANSPPSTRWKLYWNPLFIFTVPLHQLVARHRGKCGMAETHRVKDCWSGNSSGANNVARQVAKRPLPNATRLFRIRWNERPCVMRISRPGLKGIQQA